MDELDVPVADGPWSFGILSIRLRPIVNQGVSVAVIRKSASNKSSVKLPWQFFNDESSSSNVSGRLPVKAEKSVSTLN